jgi:hypothetical protein
MAIESIGYPGSIEPGPSWGLSQMGLGRRYWVKSPSDCKVTPRSNGTRQVNISAGYIGGWGVVDHNTSTAVVTLPTVSSGTRWFAVYARRNWNSGNVGTTFVADTVGLTSSATLPERNTDGDGSDGGSGLDDQPLALVPLTAGATVPGTPIDLRVFSSAESGLMVASSDLVLQYMNEVGDVIRIGNKTYSRVINSAGSPVWDVDPEVVRSGPNLGNPLKVNGGSGWTTVSKLVTRGTRSGNIMTMYFQARRTGATISSTNGNVSSDPPILTVGNADWHPPYAIPCEVYYIAASHANYGGSAIYTTDGELQLVSIVPGSSVGKTSEFTSIRAAVTWVRE